jgi:hypothetical protein
VRRRVLQGCGHTLLECYGMTEIAMALSNRSRASAGPAAWVSRCTGWRSGWRTRVGAAVSGAGHPERKRRSSGAKVPAAGLDRIVPTSRTESSRCRWHNPDAAVRAQGLTSGTFFAKY